MPAMAARSKSPTPTPIPAMAPGPMLFLAGVVVVVIRTRIVVELGFLLSAEVASAVEAVEELLVGVVDGSAEDGPTVLPMAV